MTANSRALQQWQRIIKQWPVDKVRPQAVSFQQIMQHRLDKYLDPTKAAEQQKIKGNAANVQPVNLVWDEAREEKQVRALDLLLGDQFHKRLPLHDALRRPASHPTYYDEVIAESERAPNRGFLTRLTDRLKGMVRLR